MAPCPPLVSAPACFTNHSVYIRARTVVVAKIVRRNTVNMTTIGFVLYDSNSREMKIYKRIERVRELREGKVVLDCNHNIMNGLLLRLSLIGN